MPIILKFKGFIKTYINWVQIYTFNSLICVMKYASSFQVQVIIKWMKPSTHWNLHTSECSKLFEGTATGNPEAHYGNLN